MTRARHRLLAHRGWPARYPENSLEGIRAVLAAGARQVEFDVQLTADQQPVVIHDADLRRLTGGAGRVTRIFLERLRDVRFGSDNTTRIPTLEEVLAEFRDYPGARVFVELKRDSIAEFGRRRSVEVVIAGWRRVPVPGTFVSFDRRACALARRHGVESIGWVLRRWSVLARIAAYRLRPDYLFIRADRIPDRADPFWPGPWRWVVYGVDDAASVRHWRARGAALIEVDDLPGLLAGDGHES